MLCDFPNGICIINICTQNFYSKRSYQESLRISLRIELELRGVVNVCSIASGNIIGCTTAVGAGAPLTVDSSPVAGFGGGGGELMLSNDGALSVSDRGRDSFSRNFTNASAKLALL